MKNTHQWKEIPIDKEGSLTMAKGFRVNALACGIRKSGKLDLALIVSDSLAHVAGFFTRNSIKAAPILVSQKHIRNGKAQAICVNSGNANCFTGEQGLRDAWQITERVASLLKIKREDILVASTGIIGQTLPCQKIMKAMPDLVAGLSVKNARKVAQAILTTDLVTKECCVQFRLGSKKVTIGGIAKGSGMIAPDMATMLGFMTTDASMTSSLLKAALKEAVESSFHCITVDGCMSTNDMVVVMANGRVDHPRIEKKGKDFQVFVKALSYVCLDLAKKVVLDGEGASKFIEIQVSGAKTSSQAKQVGRRIAESNLVKSINYSANPNWGRVAAAVGSLRIKLIKEENLKITFHRQKKNHVILKVDLGIGDQGAVVYTSDLTKKYVEINNQYC